MGGINMISVKPFIVILFLLPLSVLLCNCIDNEDNHNNDYATGIVQVEFIGGITETQAYEIINQYNLTILMFSFGENDTIENCDVDIPNGKEKYYAELLKQDPCIKDVELFWKY